MKRYVVYAEHPRLSLAGGRVRAHFMGLAFVPGSPWGNRRSIVVEKRVYLRCTLETEAVTSTSEP